MGDRYVSLISRSHSIFEKLNLECVTCKGSYAIRQNGISRQANAYWFGELPLGFSHLIGEKM